MTTDANDQGQDVFDDSDAGSSANAGEMAFTSEDGTGKGSKIDGDDDQAGDTGTDDDGKSQSGEEDASATPAEGQDDDQGVVTDDKGQKMIPEHRFKAALKDVTAELEETKNKLKEYETPKVEVPDKDVDPEGHDLHVRMEASKQVMMEMRPDYQEVINHYAEMAKDNDLLNQAVSKHPLPAKLAYDIAKKDLEIKEALTLKDSAEFKEFQEWKKTKKASDPANTPEEKNLNRTISRGLNSVPNLNRSTNASPNRNVRQNSSMSNDADELFKGAL